LSVCVSYPKLVYAFCLSVTFGGSILQAHFITSRLIQHVVLLITTHHCYITDLVQLRFISTFTVDLLLRWRLRQYISPKRC